MKKTSLLIAIMFIFSFTLSAQSQFEKGKMLAGMSTTSVFSFSESGCLGGVMGFNFSTISYKFNSEPREAEYRIFSYNLLPQAGYFVIDNLVVGLGLNLSGKINKHVEYDDKWKELDLLIGPFARYYYPLEKFYPFGEATILLGAYKNSSMDKAQGASVIGIGGGAAMPIGEMVSIDAALKYLRHSSKSDVPANGSSGGTLKQAVGGIGFNIGVTFYLDGFF